MCLKKSFFFSSPQTQQKKLIEEKLLFVCEIQEIRHLFSLSLPLPEITFPSTGVSWGDIAWFLSNPWASQWWHNLKPAPQTCVKAGSLATPMAPAFLSRVLYFSCLFFALSLLFQAFFVTAADASSSGCRLLRGIASKSVGRSTKLMTSGSPEFDALLS